MLPINRQPPKVIKRRTVYEAVGFSWVPSPCVLRRNFQSKGKPGWGARLTHISNFCVGLASNPESNPDPSNATSQAPGKRTGPCNTSMPPQSYRLFLVFYHNGGAPSENLTDDVQGISCVWRFLWSSASGHCIPASVAFQRHTVVTASLLVLSYSVTEMGSDHLQWALQVLCNCGQSCFQLGGSQYPQPWHWPICRLLQTDGEHHSWGGFVSSADKALEPYPAR